MNGRDQLVVLQSTQYGTGLNIYNANLSIAMSVRFDGFNESFRGREPRGLWRIDDLHYRVLFLKEEDAPYWSTTYNHTLSVVELALNDTGIERSSAVDIARLDDIHPEDCAFAQDGRSVFVVYSNGELYLKAVTLSGQEKFKDVRLTPTDDTVRWLHTYS